ncbi:MAG: hypothetical protein IPN59_11560 [Holophaga sp.]|nr:hypothetical protein [Holophaga sp.]
MALKLDQLVGSLPVQIYTYAVSPMKNGTDRPGLRPLSLVLLVLILNILARC